MFPFSGTSSSSANLDRGARSRTGGRNAGPARSSSSCVSGAGLLTRALRKCEAALIMRGGMDQRATIRAAAEGLVQVTMRCRTGHVRLRNLSVGGCLIEMNDSDCLEGDEIVISLIEGVQVRGRLVWNVQGLAGVAFEEGIHPVLIDHLKVKPTRAPFENWIPRDRFGRTLGSR